MSLLRKARDEKMFEMIKEGATYEEVGQAFKITRQRVHQIVKRRLSTASLQTLDKQKTEEYTGT